MRRSRARWPTTSTVITRNIFNNLVMTELVKAKTNILHQLFDFLSVKLDGMRFVYNCEGWADRFHDQFGGEGVEGFFGPIGLRLEVGDDICFDHGSRNNLRMTIG